MPAFVKSYSKSQARLMFVTTLGMDNFDCTKMNAHFKKFTACLQEGLIRNWKQALLASPLPLSLKETQARILDMLQTWQSDLSLSQSQ